MGRPPKSDSPSQSVTVRLAPNLVADLDATATRTGRSRTALVEDALLLLLHGTNAPVEAANTAVAAKVIRKTEPRIRPTETPIRKTELAGCQHDWEFNTYLGTRCKHCGASKPR